MTPGPQYRIVLNSKFDKSLSQNTVSLKCIDFIIQKRNFFVNRVKEINTRRQVINDMLLVKNKKCANL